ncbi:MAG: chemotaxis protein CheA, partial [Betaproteobacteria bacterium]|nr:chemotaxis protein CheA [Betaproteobacteria bacterium]
MSVDISQFQQVFFEEVAENLANMEGLLLGIDIAVPSDDDLNAIFRAAHSIKGGAGMFGLNDVASFTHELETLLDRIRKHDLQLTAGHVDAFLEAGDVIRSLVAGHRGEGAADPVAVDSSRSRLIELAGAVSGVAAIAPAPVPAPSPVATAPKMTVVRNVTGWLLQLGPMPVDLLERVRPDLEGYGLLEVREAPDKKATSGTWTFELTGMATEEALRGELEFVLPPEAIRIEPVYTETEVPAPAEDDGFGFFDDEPAVAVAAASAAATTPLVEDEGFGFFDDEPM